MKSTIRLSLFLLLLTQTVFGQTRTVQKDAFIQSRDNNNQPSVFSTNRNLYPLQLAALNKNAIYEIKGNKIKFYVFEGMSINQALITNLNGMSPTQNTFTESNDIYLDQDTYGVRVLRSGEFEYKTYKFQGKQRIITFEAILDVIPKDAYYFDFPGKNTVPVKDCYNTLNVNEQKAFLTFQKKQTITENELIVEWLKPEATTKLQRAQKITNDETLKSSWTFDLRYTQTDRIEVENRDQIFFYKLNNINTVFRLKVRIGFGCPPKNNIKVNPLGGNIFIPPYAEPFKQPNSTDMDVKP
jgi:hypothetical protein